MSGLIVTSDFLQDVARAFATLIHRRLLAIVSSTYDAQAFGDAAVVLAGSGLRVRLVRDRSQVIAEVACADRPTAWSSLQRVLQVILGPAAPAEGILTTDEAARIVEAYHVQLQDACSPARVGETRARLAELDRQALKEFIERKKGGRSE
jgi:hypothetical protein